jgi:hypothetical protein
MFSIESDQFKRSLDDVIRWCAVLPLTSEDRDSPTVLLRHALLEQANRLWEEARQVANSGWRRRSIQDTEQGKAAKRLFAEILESAGPIVSGFRNPQLMPSLNLSQYLPDTIQRVFSQAGLMAGTILWECKL